MTKARWIGAAAVAATMMAGCAGKQLPKEAITNPGQVIFNGYGNPKATCFKCHNGDGHGAFMGPDLSVRAKKLTADKAVRTIHDGKSRMPSFKGDLTDDEMTKLADWIMTLPSNKP